MSVYGLRKSTSSGSEGARFQAEFTRFFGLPLKLRLADFVLVRLGKLRLGRPFLILRDDKSLLLDMIKDRNTGRVDPSILLEPRCSVKGVQCSVATEVAELGAPKGLLSVPSSLVRPLYRFHPYSVMDPTSRTSPALNFCTRCNRIADIVSAPN